MSLYRKPRSPFWHYDFEHKGHRFFGTTKKTTRREAEAVERRERERARGLVAQTERAKTSLRLDDVAGRYWDEHAQYLAGAPNIFTMIGVLLEYFGKDKLVTEITDDDVAKLVAWRRGHRKTSGVPKGNAGNTVSPYTV